jgi:NAD+-dependent protein deacetylase SIR2
MKETLDLKEIPRCPKCDGLVKPNIVFFGEALPDSFWTSRYDMHNAGTASSPVTFC